MSVKVANNRLIVPSLRDAFYQQLLSRVSGFQELGKKAVREAERATDFRDTDKLENLAMILSNIPIREYQLIGQYHLGWAGYLKGESNQSIFEEVLEKSQTYKARAFIGLAALEARKGDYGSEWLCCINRKAAMLVILVCEEKENQAHLPPSQLETV